MTTPAPGIPGSNVPSTASPEGGGGREGASPGTPGNPGTPGIPENPAFPHGVTDQPIHRSTDSPLNQSTTTHAPDGPRVIYRSDASRQTLLWWCLWLLGSWTVTLSLHGAGAAVRWMVMACLVGYSLAWPVLRLSQGEEWLVGSGAVGAGRSRRILWRMGRDWLSLFVVLQAVIWPLRVTANWSLEQTGWLIGALGSWSLLVGAIITWGVRSNGPWRRTVAMLLCVLALLGEPAWMGLSGPGGIKWEPMLSPLKMIWSLAGSPVDWDAQVWAQRVIATGLSALAMWILLIIFHKRAGRRTVGDDRLSVSR